MDTFWTERGIDPDTRRYTCCGVEAFNTREGALPHGWFCRAPAGRMKDMTCIKGSIWKTGTKDAGVYFELWDGAGTRKIVDGELSPDQAYNIGKALMDNAIMQGYMPASDPT